MHMHIHAHMSTHMHTHLLHIIKDSLPIAIDGNYPVVWVKQTEW